MNEKPYSHNSHHGTRFGASRCDFMYGVNVVKPKEVNLAQYTADVAEMIVQHALQIHPQLNGFAGYDAIRFTVVDVQSPEGGEVLKDPEASTGDDGYMKNFEEGTTDES
ncbi:MAG: hypothetical protein KAR06_08015 [Deltaproteobacteria bacterium]|nr:hypothetical protein [Deltaproteobacteria bacterium]